MATHNTLALNVLP